LIVEVIAVGTELLIGQIINSNGAYIGSRLAEEGFDAHFQVVVGDNLGRMVSAIELALDRADAVLLTGGIGPTQDDLTREALCRVGGREMTRDERHAAWIEDRIRSQRGTVNPTVLRMADVPEGAEGLPNANGVALGVAMEHHGKWLFAVPGVPVEMKTMLDEQVIPRLRSLTGDHTVLRSRVLRTWGMGESQVAELLDDLFVATNPSVAFLISDMEVKVRITAKAADEAGAEALIAPIDHEVRTRLGDAVFAVDEETVEGLVVAGLEDRGWALATTERATLGQVGARILASGRAGRVFAATVVPGSTGEGLTPAAHVVLTVGEIGVDRERGPRTTRPVEITVTTPEVTLSRVFEFGGDDERVRSFATIAGLHQLRIAITGTSQTE